MVDIKDSPGISLFFPVYNDEHTIKEIVSAAVKCVTAFTNNYEIILINDASLDNSGKICDNLRKHNNKIKVIHHSVNRDYGGVLKSGFLNVNKDLVFYTNSDGQFDISELDRLLALIKGNDVVVGYRILRSDGLNRILLGKIYNFIVTSLFRLKVKDVTCDFRLFKKEVIKSLNLKSNSGFICVELMKEIQKKGFKIAETVVSHYPRKFGKSQVFQAKRIFRMIKDLFIYLAKWQSRI